MAKLPTVGVRMAIAVVAMLPIFVLFPFLQKYFQKGIALGAVKG
jgi:putative aldouronate transport system permease protein